MLLGIVNICQEHGVDESGFSKATLADHHQRELEASLDCLAVDLIGEIGKANVAIQLLQFGLDDGLLLLLLHALRGHFVGVLIVIVAVLLFFEYQLADVVCDAIDGRGWGAVVIAVQVRFDVGYGSTVILKSEGLNEKLVKFAKIGVKKPNLMITILSMNIGTMIVN